MKSLLLLMMKILFFSSVLMVSPMPVWIVISAAMMILLVLSLDIFNIMVFSSMLMTNMISVALTLLTFWVMMLMFFSQMKSIFMGGLSLMFSILTLALVLSFTVDNLMLFYFFFESSLIPIFSIVLGWGYQMERLKASFFLLMYTLFASLPLLFSILLIMKCSFSLNVVGINVVVYNLNSFLMGMMLMAFLVKFPMFMVHQWLPKAHVEAPVSGSMILAGVLLKLGGYGILRFMVFINLSKLISFLMMFSLLGGAILGISCLTFSDIKVMIAYSSVVHMAMIIVSLLSTYMVGISGGIMIMIAHGICSSGMFSCANMIYERSHSRSLMMNKGGLNMFPSTAIMWFLLCMANFGGPFTLNLLGEVVMIFNMGWLNYYLLSGVVFISFFSAAYSLILYANTQQGSSMKSLFLFNSMSMRELAILFSHVWPVIILIVIPLMN